MLIRYLVTRFVAFTNAALSIGLWHAAVTSDVGHDAVIPATIFAALNIIGVCSWLVPYRPKK